MKGSGKNRGFTLFEVLIAVSIFAIIGVIAMTNLIQVHRQGCHATGAAAGARSLR